MAHSNAFDISNNIRTHGYVVGVILALETIVSVSYLAFGDREAVFPEHAEIFNEMRKVLLYVDLVALIITILYWIGFLKRIRFCLLICMVYVGLQFILAALCLIGDIVTVNVYGMVHMLIVLGINGYFWHVMAELRRAKLNESYQNGVNV